MTRGRPPTSIMKALMHFRRHPEDLDLPSRECGTKIGVSHRAINAAKRELEQNEFCSARNDFARRMKKTKHIIKSEDGCNVEHFELDNKSNEEFVYNAHSNPQQEVE